MFSWGCDLKHTKIIHPYLNFMGNSTEFSFYAPHIYKLSTIPPETKHIKISNSYINK